jgi:DNA polymerase III delta prime subunit
VHRSKPWRVRRLHQLSEWLPQRRWRAGSSETAMRRQLDATLLGVGVACLLAAITAGAVEVLGNKLPVVDSPVRQILLGIVGVGFIVASRFFAVSKERSGVLEPETVAPVGISGIDLNTRRQMLERVRAFWIKEMLEQSLDRVVRIELGLEESPDAVERPLDLLAPGLETSPQPVPAGTPVAAVFDQMDRALLILGGPGAGKTTLLLELARDLLDQAERDPKHPLPVVFNLSSWAIRRRPLEEWLVDELRKLYVVPRHLGRAWVESEQIAPLLDGLDEVPPEHRGSCIQAINAFRERHGFLPLAVCSRAADYEALVLRLRLQGAIVIQPLTRPQVNQYLRQAGKPLAGVRAALRDDPTLWELLDSPLLLSIVTLAYKARSAAALRASGSPEQRRARLFAAYTDEMFRRRAEDAPYARRQTLRWLGWLARSMAQHNQTVFQLEWMQPDWLPRGLRWLVTAGVAITMGFLAALPWFVSAIAWIQSGIYWEEDLLIALLPLLIGIPVGLAGYDKAIQPAERLRWSWASMRRSFRRSLLAGFTVGTLIGLIIGTYAWLQYRPWSTETSPSLLPYFGPALVYGLVLGLALSLLLWPLNGLTGQLSEARTGPNEGIRRSVRHAVVSGTLATLGAGLIAALLLARAGLGEKAPIVVGFSIGATIGLIVALQAGGRAYLQHLVLRILLVLTRKTPWNWVRFLDYAVRRLFLRRVGPGYLFMHRSLLEYFAELQPESSPPLLRGQLHR